MSKSTGVVASFMLGTIPVTVRELTLKESERLAKRLDCMAKAAMGPLGLFAEFQGVLDELARLGKWEDRRIIIENITNKVESREALSPAALYDFASGTVDGVIESVLARTTDKGLTKDVLTTLINKTNAADVFMDMIEALGEKKESQLATS